MISDVVHLSLTREEAEHLKNALHIVNLAALFLSGSSGGYTNVYGDLAARIEDEKHEPARLIALPGGKLRKAEKHGIGLRKAD